MQDAHKGEGAHQSNHSPIALPQKKMVVETESRKDTHIERKLTPWHPPLPRGYWPEVVEAGIFNAYPLITTTLTGGCSADFGLLCRGRRCDLMFSINVC